MNPAPDPEFVDPPGEVVEADPMEWEDPGLLEKRDDPPSSEDRSR
jgi:hypothetical protein